MLRSKLAAGNADDEHDLDEEQHVGNAGRALTLHPKGIFHLECDARHHNADVEVGVVVRLKQHHVIAREGLTSLDMT